MDRPLGSEYELDELFWSDQYAEFVEAYRLSRCSLLKDLERTAYACLVRVVGVDPPPGPKTRVRVLKRLKRRPPFSTVSFYGARGTLPVGATGLLLLCWLPPWMLFPLPGASSWMPVIDHEGAPFAVVDHPGANYLPPDAGALNGTYDGLPAQLVPLEQMERILSVSQSWFSPIRALLAWARNDTE
ncbi:hypothetical protein [Gemmata obscuriglobus]|uniref:hypothetical protein n=1 Tax=Gemmata obscuriglobus TaxID=114 RepID=UPI000497A846|nr:hypothetical protein [Gemmata obscuriglobus]